VYFRRPRVAFSEIGVISAKSLAVPTSLIYSDPKTVNYADFFFVLPPLVPSDHMDWQLAALRMPPYSLSYSVHWARCMRPLHGTLWEMHAGRARARRSYNGALSLSLALSRSLSLPQYALALSFSLSHEWTDGLWQFDSDICRRARCIKYFRSTGKRAFNIFDLQKNNKVTPPPLPAGKQAACGLRIATWICRKTATHKWDT
jgi:hypothetical protein